MTLKIDAPVIEDRIRELASRQGIAAETYLMELITSHLPAVDWNHPPLDLQGSTTPTPRLYETATPEQLKKALQEWAARYPVNTPLIPDEALHRENLYEDRGL